MSVLVARRHAEFVLSVAGIGSFALSAYSFFAIASIYERIDAILYAFAFFAAGLVGGWALATSLLERLGRAAPAVQVPGELPPDNGAAAVIVLSCSEPRTYDPSVTAGTLRTLADEGVLNPSMTTLPFLFFAQKTRYRAIGGTSPARGQLTALAERLELSLTHTPVRHVDVAACSGRDQLSAKIIDAVALGYRTIIVVGLAISESLHQAKARQDSDSLRLGDLGVRLRFTDPLADSDRIAAMLCAAVTNATAEPADTGVVLVGHGQPEDRSRRFPSYDEEETAFLNRIRMSIIDTGVPEHNIRVAWAEWRSPDVTSAVRHLAALGCHRVIVVPGVFPLETIGTRLDLEMAVRQARVDESVSVVTLPAWRDHDEVVEEIAERVARELGGTPT